MTRVSLEENHLRLGSGRPGAIVTLTAEGGEMASTAGNVCKRTWHLRAGWCQKGKVDTEERKTMQYGHGWLLTEDFVIRTGPWKCRTPRPSPSGLRLKGVNKKSKYSSNNTVTEASRHLSGEVWADNAPHRAGIPEGWNERARLSLCLME